MKLTGSLMTLPIVACVLLTAGFFCGNSETKTAPPSAVNAAANTATVTPAATTKPVSKDISGNYAATGKNADGGGNYDADLVVTNRDEVYQFSWNSKGNKYDGVGVMRDDKVAVSYTDGTNGEGCGVVLYKINADGSLDGTAGYWGNNSKETETATRTSGTDLEGEYDIRGKNPKGEDYTGKLKVRKDGAGFRFSWSGANGFDGFGVKTGDSVSVGFGGAKCSFVAYEVKSDGSLEGKWGGAGSNEFGTETAKKK